MSSDEITDQGLKSSLDELQALLDKVGEINSQTSNYAMEFGDPLHYDPFEDEESSGSHAMSDGELRAEYHHRKKTVGEIIGKLSTNIEILKQGANNRFERYNSDDEAKRKLLEISKEIDMELRITVRHSKRFLEVVNDYFDMEWLQEEWDSAIDLEFEKHWRKTESAELLLHENLFLDKNSEILSEYKYENDLSTTPNPHGFIKMVLIRALDSVYGCITALTMYLMNTNEYEEIKELFGHNLAVESYGDTARQFLSNSEVMASYHYPMTKDEADEVNTILHSLTWSMRKFCTTLESLPIGEGMYKPILSDVNSHIATDSFRPRETYKNLGMWPLEREEEYYSLSELDLNNWLGEEQHSQKLSVESALHRITYRDFIDFIQILGYEHKKVTSYRGFRRSKPTLTMYEWDGRNCKYRPDSHLYFYNPQCPISGAEMRIVIDSVVYRGGGDLTVHAGLELFQFSKDVNNSNDVLYDEQILSIRESTENFIQQLWKDFDTYQRENGLLKNSKFDAMITQLNPKGRTFDDMIISDSKKKLLDENIFAILSNSERLIERGVETNRGIMLAGPPGVGKSLTIDAVISKADCTVVFTNFLMLRKNMEWIFELSRRYAPTVLILEDIDALGITGQRGEGGTGAGLSTLLNCMDGINSNNGVISVATSNHPEQMDWALIARPGRFDVRIDYPYPDKDVLRSIMELKLSSYQTVDDLDLDALVKTMPLGFTGSHIHDIVNQANYISINNSKAAAKKVKITQESLASATERTLYNFNKFLDERPHIQLQNPPSVQEVLKGTKGKKENYHQ
jgi:AAA+ superfamily predicted ATPase